MGQPEGFEGRLAELDTTLFDSIPSQTTNNDKRSLLAVQLALRSLLSTYRYLEIGSYLGGSIQTHLLDPSCSAIYSIDKRPASQPPDNNGLRLRYPNNTTARMMESLRALAPAEKVSSLFGDSATVQPSLIGEPVDVCFIDGEHRDEEVTRDFEFCRSAVGDSGVVVFHDAQLVYRGILRALDSMRGASVGFHAYNLPSTLLVVEIGDVPIHRHPAIAAMLIDNHIGYLESLEANDHFRRWATSGPVRLMRAVKSRLTRADVSP